MLYSVGIFIIYLIYSCIVLCHYFCNMRNGFIISIFCCSSQLFANDSLLIPKLFQKLLYKQQLETNFFKQGSFESYRQHHNSLDFKADNNIFFTALITYTLQNLQALLTEDEKIVSDTIINRSQKSYQYYKNTAGRLSYNFWPKDDKPVFFPNDFILSRFSKKLALPDDLDDTGLILASLSLPDSIAEQAHQEMQEFVNGNKHSIKNTKNKYKNFKAYSTWYGKKMPIDFDFGVHCNILSFVNHYKLNWSKADSATYLLILSMIDDQMIFQNPKFISPYYANSAVLLYHLARLMSTNKMIELESRKPILIAAAKKLFYETDVYLEKVVLLNSLLKWNADITDLGFDATNALNKLYLNDFVYYHGHLFAHLNSSIKTLASNLPQTEFKWFSSAFNDCLLLEYLILKYRKPKNDH